MNCDFCKKPVLDSESRLIVPSEKAESHLICLLRKVGMEIIGNAKVFAIQKGKDPSVEEAVKMTLPACRE